MHTRPDNAITHGYFPLDRITEELYSHSTPLLLSSDNDDARKLRFAFSVPEDISSIPYKNPTELLATHKQYARTSLAHWQSYINVEIEEINPAQDLILPDVRAYQVELNMPKIPAMTKSMRALGFQLRSEVFFDYSVFNKYNDCVLIKHTITHELGHTLGLDHPFEILDGKHFSSHASSTLYSVMNYNINDLYRHEGSKLISFPVLPTTPMLADIELVQKIYGVNTKVGLGDDVYDLSEYVTHSATFKSIACLPWDNSGTDTLLLPDSFDVQYKKVVVDLRPFGLCDLEHGYVVIPDIKVENFIGGKNSFLDITLNEQNNIIDLRDVASAIVHADLESGGHDIIYGINKNSTNTLELGTVWPYYLKKKWIKIHDVVWPETQIADHAIPACSGTRLERYDYDGSMIGSITLCDTTSEELKVKVKTSFNEEFIKFIDDNNALFGYLPKELLTDFSSAFKNSVLFTFLMGLTEESLLKYGCTKNQVELIKNSIIMPLLALMNGNLIASIVSTGTVSILKYFNFSDYTCMAIGSLVYNGERLGEMLTPWGFAKFCATSAGSLCGSTLTLFAKNKVKEYFHPPEAQHTGLAAVKYQ